MVKPSDNESRILSRHLYNRMLVAAGPRQWWPREFAVGEAGRDEIIIGAVLTQNTNWLNVRRALASLHEAGLLDLARLSLMEPAQIAPLIRSAGYFNVKARRLSAVARFFAPGGRHRFAELLTLDDATLRAAVLAVHGVGRETADSILLYALERRSFVVDAYTLRIGRRHGIFTEKTDYETARAWFTAHVAPDAAVYNEYHALLVWIGNNYCKPTPRCRNCPLSQRDCFANEISWRKLGIYREPSLKIIPPKR